MRATLGEIEGEHVRIVPYRPRMQQRPAPSGPFHSRQAGSEREGGMG
jgi:hypothetical protein